MTYILKFIIDHNDKGVELTEHDLLALLFVFDLRTVKQTQLLELMTSIPNTKLKNVDSFYRKIKKWETEKLELIKREEQVVVPGTKIRTYSLEIGSKGKALLFLSGLLDFHFRKRLSERRNKEHHFGIVETVLQMYLMFAKVDGIVISVSKISGNVINLPYIFDAAKFLENLQIDNELVINRSEKYHITSQDISVINQKYQKPLRSPWTLKELILTNKSALLTSYNGNSNLQLYLDGRNQELPIPINFKQSEQQLIPDWIFKIKEHTYCIEIDAMTEGKPILLDKLKKYMELSKSDPRQNYTMYFIMLDDSIKMRKEFKWADVIKKLQSYKYDFFVNNINNKEDANVSLRLAPDNLEVYVLPLYRMQSVFKKTVHYQKQTLEDERFREYKLDGTVVIEASLALKNAFDEFEYISNPREWFKSSPDYDIPKVGILFKDSKTEVAYFPFVIREGNVKSMDKIGYFADKLNSTLNTQGGKILAIYEFEDEVLNDIHSKLFFEHVEKDTIHIYCLETGKFYNQTILGEKIKTPIF